MHKTMSQTLYVMLAWLAQVILFFTSDEWLWSLSVLIPLKFSVCSTFAFDNAKLLHLHQSNSIS